MEPSPETADDILSQETPRTVSRNGRNVIKDTKCDN